jgi:hypothetical protein
MPVFRPFRAVLLNSMPVIATAMVCRRVTTVDYARAPFPRVDDPVDTDSTANGPKHSGRLPHRRPNMQERTDFDC